MIKKCNKSDCNIIYETMWQTPKIERSNKEAVKDYLYETMRKLKFNTSLELDSRAIILFLQQEIDILET
tara:strand:- start:5846 stop:6052 length:207 start_codon:yes stop_codon:yes gene_type:complete